MLRNKLFNNLLRICDRRRPEITCRVLSHTLMMERWWEILTPRLNTAPRLKRKHDIYKVKRIEYGLPNLTIVLTKDSMNYGVFGEKITLSKPIARELLIKKEAIYASPDNIKELKKIERVMQTQSGRRMIFWIQSQSVLNCPFQISNNKDWVLTKENLSRCLQRQHKFHVSPSCITLPDYPINSQTEMNNHEEKSHTIQISVNKDPPVSLSIKIENWDPTQT